MCVTRYGLLCMEINDKLFFLRDQPRQVAVRIEITTL